MRNVLRKQIRLEQIDWEEFYDLTQQQKIKLPSFISLYNSYAKLYSPQYSSFSPLLKELERENKKDIRMISVTGIWTSSQARSRWREYKKNGVPIFPELEKIAHMEDRLLIEYYASNKITRKGEKTYKDILRFARSNDLIFCVYAFVRRESLEKYTVDTDFKGDFEGLHCVGLGKDDEVRFGA